MGGKKVVQLEELPKSQIKMYVLTPGYLQVGNSTGKTIGFWGAAFQKKRRIVTGSDKIVSYKPVAMN